MSLRRIKVHGRKVWQARVAYRGLRKSTIRESKEAARQAEAELLGELKAKVAAEDHVDQAPATLSQLLTYYVEDLEARGKAPDSVGRARETLHVLERLAPELLAKPVGAIRDGDLFGFRTIRLREGRIIVEKDAAGEKRERRVPAKPSTINRDLRTLRAAMKRAVPDYRFPAGVFLPEDETRVRWLRPEEELLLDANLRSPFREIARLAALTLMRLSEIRLLRREHVHLEQGVVMLPRAKAGARPVILSGQAQKLLRAQLEEHAGEWVFPGPDGAPYDRSYVGRVFRRASRAAGLRDFRFHDLRHHGATMALNRGFTAPIVMALGGWKTERMMRRYAAVTDQTLRAAAEAVSGGEVSLEQLAATRTLR